MLQWDLHTLRVGQNMPAQTAFWGSQEEQAQAQEPGPVPVVWGRVEVLEELHLQHAYLNPVLLHNRPFCIRFIFYAVRQRRTVPTLATVLPVMAS